jgi:eukaryotic-like serine/threonine-protein kinase
MSPAPGTLLGPYELLSTLGAGGMGEVFEARDTRLDRRVAVKILRPARFAGMSEARARFEHEARAIAALNHPHICTLHDVGRQGDIEYLVMERLEGQTLAQRLARGPLPVAEVFLYAGQIADALDCAHRHRIVHRDLKPANIMLVGGASRASGTATAKLLDFGVASLKDPVGERKALTQAVTVAGKSTVFGTLQYMSPEQVEGREADARSDLFAFGCVVYEMLTGRPAFEGPNPARLVAAVLESDPPPLAQARPDAPPPLRILVETCLAKNPDHRWASAHDACLLLQRLSREPAADSETLAGRVMEGIRRRPVAWMVPPIAIVAVVVALILGAQRLRPAAVAPLDVLSVLPPAGTALTVGEAPEVSPDGRSVAFVATDEVGRTLLYVRPRGADARPLPDTDDATLPFWSPDSRRLGFFARGSLKTVPAAGGRVQTLAAAPVPRGGTWSVRDEILFVAYPNSMPESIPATGGTPTRVAASQPDSDRRWFPSFLPDGRRYVYLSIDPKRRTGLAIRLASIDSTEVTTLLQSSTSAIYTEPGYLLFRQDGALMAQPFDARSARLQGSPVVVARQVGFNAIGYRSLVSASSHVVALVEPSAGWQLTWFDSAGARVGTVAPPGQYNSACLTGDGKYVVYDAADPRTGNIDLWSFDLARGVSTRLTYDPAVDFYPVCSSNGDEVVFASLRAGPPALFRLRISSPGTERLLHQTSVAEIPSDWSADGKWILYSAFNPKTSWDVWALPMVPGQEPAPLVASPAEERNARFSPNGRFMAYVLLEGGTSDVIVEPFPPTGTRWQVSREGGRQPVWSPDGRQLYYVSADKKLIAVAITTEAGTLAVGTSRVVAETRMAGLERNTQGASFLVTSDGKRFLSVEGGDEVRPITLLLNWAGGR